MSLAPTDLPASQRRHINIVDLPGDDPAFVLMHGFPDDLRIYNRLAPLLAPRRVVAFDFFGYGRSGRGDASTVMNPREDLDAVVESLGLEHFTLVGHDASGPIAIEYALDQPGRVDQLVLLDTYYGHAPTLRLPEMIRMFADQRLAPLADAMVADPAQLIWLLQHTGRQFFGTDEVPPDGIAATAILPTFFGDAEQPDALSAIRSWTRALFADLDEQDERVANGDLAALHTPVTLIFGADDAYLNPSLALHLASHFPRADTHMVPDASHWPQWDRPDVVAQLLLASEGGA